MKNKKLILFSLIGIILFVVVFIVIVTNQQSHSGDRQKVIINEAVRTILYLPLYHAQEKGYFKEVGLDVHIVTGGTATNSFAALMSGEAQFSQADPMYVPISREKGGRTKLVAQVVGRIAVWGLSFDTSVHIFDKNTLKGKSISTQTRPMTAYTYSVKMLNDFGLTPEKDVKIIESKSPNEIIPFLKKDVDFLMTLEPNASIAESKGAKVVWSYPKELGDQIFTGLMTTEDYISVHPEIVKKVVLAYQKALDDLHQNPESGIASAKKYFNQLDETILRDAIKRMVHDEVIPKSVRVSQKSWDKAIEVRLKAGDLKSKISLANAFYPVNF